MEKILNKLAETDNSGWTCVQKGEPLDNKHMTYAEDVVLEPRAETANTIAAVGQLPDCAVLIIAKEENFAALSAATELYASAKHFGQQANFLLLRGKAATPEALGEKCKQIVIGWHADQLDK